MEKKLTPVQSITPKPASVFPSMTIEQDGNKVYASMEYNGVTAQVRLSLQFIYMTKDEKFHFLKVNKVAQELLRKVGFDVSKVPRTQLD